GKPRAPCFDLRALSASAPNCGRARVMSALSRHPFPLAAGAALLLAGCGADEAARFEPERDPALIAALGEPIMIDPDLVGQNRANSAAAMPSHDGSLPTIDRNPDTIAAARAEASRLVGGSGEMRKAPTAREVEGAPPADTSLAAAARAAASPNAKA